MSTHMSIHVMSGDEPEYRIDPPFYPGASSVLFLDFPHDHSLSVNFANGTDRQRLALADVLEDYARTLREEVPTASLEGKE